MNISLMGEANLDLLFKTATPSKQLKNGQGELETKETSILSNIHLSEIVVFTFLGSL